LNDQGALTKEEIEKLLRYGAYDIFNEDKAGTAEAESNDFVQQDIDSILLRRSRTVVHESAKSQPNSAGSSFSKASYRFNKDSNLSKNETQDIDIEDPDFWKKMVGVAMQQNDTNDYTNKPRRRKKLNYSEDAMLQDADTRIDSDSSAIVDSESSSEDEDDLVGTERTSQDEPPPKKWKRDQLESLVKFLHTWGYTSDTLKSLTKHFACAKSFAEVQVSCYAFLVADFVPCF
jgi:hypothetical protein